MPTLSGNYSQWESELGNLIRKALTYQEKGKVAEVRVWAEEEEALFYVFVQDSGIGVEPQ